MAESLVKDELTLVEEGIARLEAEVSRQLKGFAGMSYNDAFELERGPMKELRELRARRNRILSARQRQEERKAARGK